MSRPKTPPEATVLDPELHAPRLKSGLVPTDTRVYLRVLQGPDRGKVFDLSPGGCYIVGRGAGDLPLSDPKVSQRHAEVKILGPGTHFIIDLASTNGTFLNGRRVERRKLAHGDEILMGESLLEFSILEGTVPVSDIE